MLGKLFLLFLIVPIVELALLIQIGDAIGFWPTLGLIILTAFAGGYLAKREGLQAWRRLQTRLGHGGLPGDELLDGVVILVSGVLLLTPGVLTDVAGILGLLPFTRNRLKEYLKTRLQRAVENRTVRLFTFHSGMPQADAHWETPAQRPLPPEDDPPRWQ